MILVILIVFSTVGCMNSGESAGLIIPAETSDNEGIVQQESQSDTGYTEEMTMKLTIGKTTLTAALVENSTTEALKDMLSEGPLSIEMRDYGAMEKVGRFPHSLPRNDQQITTEAGDLILYQGNAFVMYYAPNSWNFTRIGKINDITASELKKILGNSDVTVTLSLD